MEGGEENKEDANKSQIDSGETTCLGCGAPSHALYHQRLLEDSCGHKKCRKCLIVEASGCSQCEVENVPVVAIADQTLVSALLQSVSNKQSNLPETSDNSRSDSRVPERITPQDSEYFIPHSSPNISNASKPCPVSTITGSIPNISFQNNTAKVLITTSVPVLNVSNSFSSDVNHEKIKKSSIHLSSSIENFENKHSNTTSNSHDFQRTPRLSPSIKSQQINEFVYQSENLISLPPSTAQPGAASPKTVSLLIDSTCLSTGVPPPDNAKVLAIQDKCVKGSAIVLPSMVELSTLKDILHHELSDNARQGCLDVFKTDYTPQRSEQSCNERAFPDVIDREKNKEIGDEIYQKILEKVQSQSSQHNNIKHIIDNSNLASKKGSPLKLSNQEAPFSISGQPKLPCNVTAERFQRISVIVPNRKLEQKTLAEAPQIQIERPELIKPQPDMIYIEERLRNELRDKNESQDLVAKHYHEDKSPSNNSNDDIEDTQNIPTQYEEYSNESSVDNDKVNDNAIGVNEDNGMMLQKNMEQDLLRELREHFQDIGEESQHDNHKYEPSFPPNLQQYHFKYSGSHIKELPTSKGSPNLNQPPMPKKTVSKYLFGEKQAASSHDNGDPFPNKYQDDTEVEKLTDHKHEERYLALEELDVGSNRSYRYDRVISSSKLTMLDKWLTHLRQDAPVEDNYIEHDSLQGEVEIGDVYDMNMLAVDDRHIDDFIEEDFDDERVDDCQDPPPLDVTSQDPEEVIQRGMVVSQNFLQEIQNAMNFESSDGDASQKGETGEEGRDTSTKGRQRREQKLLPGHIMVKDEDDGLLFCNKCEETFLFDQCNKHINCKGKKITRAPPKKMRECSYCDKQCRSSSHLKYHIRSVHTGERPYKCTFCSMSFLQMVKLKRHILTHTGEKPYECDICDASFRTGYHLKEHRNIHTRGIQNSCQVCHRSFADSSNLRRHMKNLHGKKTVACQTCTKLFPTKHDLFVHKKEHLSVAKQQYNCQFCDKKFTTQTGVNRHTNSSHSKNLNLPANSVRQTKDQVFLVFPPAPYSNTSTKIQNDRTTHSLPIKSQKISLQSNEDENPKNDSIMKRNCEIETNDLKCTPTKKIHINNDSQQTTKDTSTSSILKALKTSPSLRKELSESLTETGLLQFCGGDEEMASKLLAELSSENKLSSVAYSSTSSSLSTTAPIDSRSSPTSLTRTSAAAHIPTMSSMELAYLKEINDRCPVSYEEEIRNYDLSTLYGKQIRETAGNEKHGNFGHHTLPPVVVQERPSLSYDNEPVAGSSKQFMGAVSSSNIHTFKYKRRPGHMVVPSVHSLPTLTPCESPSEQHIKGISKEDDIQNTHQYDPIKNINMQEKVILKKLFEENRLEVPAEFQDVEDSVANRPEVKQLEDQEAATKKRFLSRYRNQSGLPSKEQKESYDPETLHSLIETSKLLLSSNSIQISLTKEQEQNFIFSMLKIIKETR